MTAGGTRLIELIGTAARQLQEAGVAFGHGTDNAFDEAAWLVLWRLGLPLDTPLDGPESAPDQPVPADRCAQVAELLGERIHSRKPAAYLTHEAWLQGVPFYVDERCIGREASSPNCWRTRSTAAASTPGSTNTPPACSTCAPATAA